jgi:hypothetical protein
MSTSSQRLDVLRLAVIAAAFGAAAYGQVNTAEVWRFDRLDRLGPHATTIQGHPRVIETPLGKAVEFDGVDDALFVDVHPLAGAQTFTWEAIFRPDGGGAEQRWFHLQEAGSENRMLFEIRVVGDRWFLDNFNQSATGLSPATSCGKDKSKDTCATTPLRVNSLDSGSGV